MKKYIIGLSILIAIGIALAYLSYKESQLLDDDVYVNTTLSIRNLQAINNDIDIALFNIRHNNKNEDSINILIETLSEEFDNLRFDALFEEIEANDNLQKATTNFETVWLHKLENIEAFVNNHQLFNEARNTFIDTAKADSDINTINHLPALQDNINKVTIHFYRYLHNNSKNNKQQLNNNIANILNTTIQYTKEEQRIINSYIKTLSDIILLSEETTKHFSLSTQNNTKDMLNELALTYVNFHNSAIEKSNTIRQALTLYGIVLLVLLIIFAYLLRKYYLSLEQQVRDRTDEIQQAYTDLQESQEQLIQSEKMASLGEMVAGVAHEINTPLGYVNSNMTTLQLNLSDIDNTLSILDDIKSEALLPNRNSRKISSLLKKILQQYSTMQQEGIFDESNQLLEDSGHGLSEISQLVMSLKDFSRLDRQTTAEVDIHESIDNALKIAANPIRENAVSVQREYSNLPPMVCMPSKMNQLFLNIITNASQAMAPNGGELRIKTHANDSHIAIAFSDQGIGMSDDTVQKMFDPFFTTKPIGKGTGLGMSIAYKIVDAHQGKIQVKSKPNIGTTIAIQLPIQPLVA